MQLRKKYTVKVSYSYSIQKSDCVVNLENKFVPLIQVTVGRNYIVEEGFIWNLPRMDLLIKLKTLYSNLEVS